VRCLDAEQALIRADGEMKIVIAMPLASTSVQDEWGAVAAGGSDTADVRSPGRHVTGLADDTSDRHA